MTRRDDRPRRGLATRLAAGGFIGFLAVLIPLITALVNKGAFDAVIDRQKIQPATPTNSPASTPTIPISTPEASNSPSPTSTPKAFNTPSPTPSSLPAMDGSQIQHSLYSVSGQGCKQQGSSLRCSLLLKSQEDKRLMLIADGTRVIDQSGNQFNAAYIEIGGERSNSVGGALLNRMQINLNKDIPLKINLVFSDASAQLNQLALVELSATDLNGTGGTIFTLKVQNVPVTQ